MDIEPRQAFLDAASLTAGIVGSGDVAARWTDPSALARLSVGGLAGHAYLACRIVIRTLDARLRPSVLPSFLHRPAG